jgi:hypothetical protein
MSLRARGDVRIAAGPRDRAQQGVTAHNVDRVVDEVVDAFIWMHIGFWIDVIVEERFVAPQLQYVNPALHNFLRNQAVRGMKRDDSIAPERADVPKGKVLYLSRMKDRAIYEVLERIREGIGDARSELDSFER